MDWILSGYTINIRSMNYNLFSTRYICCDQKSGLQEKEKLSLQYLHVTYIIKVIKFKFLNREDTVLQQSVLFTLPIANVTHFLSSCDTYIC